MPNPRNSEEIKAIELESLHCRNWFESTDRGRETSDETFGKPEEVRVEEGLPPPSGPHSPERAYVLKDGERDM